VSLCTDEQSGFSDTMPFSFLGEVIDAVVSLPPFGHVVCEVQLCAECIDDFLYQVHGLVVDIARLAVVGR